ncbi:hypothetical protein [Candidatus Ichthyocystis hellenicum]|uniref:hypothetical protein n=1 Tax=Candidatus Ichthyocystis hellenicum TaxID=1561003 RepID=UPI000AFAD0DB|nr:hypothetical protein [Candidatus Ichthyocystis hellenicum]
MYGTSTCSNNHSTREYCDRSSIGSNDKQPLDLVVPASTISATATFTAHNDLSLCPQHSFDWYRHSSNLEIGPEVCNDYFLQEYSIKCGYKLTEDFLSIMNKYKVDFVDKINPILICLSGNFSFFLKKLEDHNKSMNEACSSFSKKVYDLRPKCIHILQCSTLPIIIDNISNTSVIDGNSERKMTYTEMEQLFLHFVFALEKLIITEIMKYWNDFCSDNKLVLALITDIDYSNPFICAYNFDKIGIPIIDCPAAFSNKFGKYLSFMTAYKLNKIINNFVSEYNCEMKEMVISKCSYIFNYSNRAYYDFNELRYNFKFLIKEEFDKKIIEKGIKDKVSNFLKNSVIWIKEEDREKNVEALIFDNVIEYMHNLLVITVTSDAYKIIKDFQEKIILSNRRSLVGGRHSITIQRPLVGGNSFTTVEYRWGLKLHPEDDRSILFIRRKFSVQIRNHLIVLFSDMLKNRTVLPSGKVLCDCFWVFVSDELLPIAVKSVKSILDAQCKELSIFLSKVRVVDVSKSDSSSYLIRKITRDEKSNLMLRVRKIMDKRLNISIRLSWLDVVGKSSKCTEHAYKNRYQGIIKVIIEEKLGVKLRSRDSIAILKTRRKFFPKIKDIVYDKFSKLVKSNHKFGEGDFINEFSWAKWSKRLLLVSKEEVKHILEDEREELEEIIFRSRVVVDSKTDRELTNEEISVVLEILMNLVFNSLRSSLRNVWNDVVSSLELGDNSEVDCIDELPSLFPNEVGIIESGTVDKGDISVLKFCYEKDITILNIRRDLSSKVYNCINNKLKRIVSERDKFDDNIMVTNSWRSVKKKLLPIIKKEINPLINSERIKIGNVLSKLRVNISSPDDHNTTDPTRCLTLRERLSLLETIVKSVCSNVSKNLSCMWNKIVKFSSVSFRDIREVDKSELHNIRIEFIGNLGPIVNEAIDSLSSDVDALSELEKINADLSSIVSERGHDFFREKGFLDRVESLLSAAQVPDQFGKDRPITDEEKNILLKEFMDIIGSDRELLVKKRISKLKNVFLSPTIDGKFEYKPNNKRKVDKVVDDLDLVSGEHHCAKKV